jgi:hypothetical protein
LAAKAITAPTAPSVKQHWKRNGWNKKGDPRMLSSTQTSLLEVQTQLWKARAQAKQKWLERTLAEPMKNSQQATRRMTWVKRALNMVKRGQAEIKYQAALMDAYAEHLTALEMTLLSAVEQQSSTGSGKSERRD